MTQNDSAATGQNGDRRRNLRSPLLVLKVKVDEGRKAFFGYAKNISRSGFFVASVNPKEPGSRFLVEMSIPAPVSRTLQSECEVVWKRHFTKGCPYEPGMGLKFLNLSDELATALDAWVGEQE